jgi:hypothetical protein
MVSETAIVMIMAMVIVTFRHRPTKTSVRTYFARIGDFLRGKGASDRSGQRLANGTQ